MASGSFDGPKDRAVLTLAIGKEIYFEMAINLARSVRLWNAADDIDFHLLTDCPSHLPKDLQGLVQLRRIKRGEFGVGFSPKLHLDRFSPADETLFIDADCLCVRNLNAVFDRFAGCDVGVIGERLSIGEHFGAIAERCRRFQVPWVPVFVGGVYFIRRSDTASRVFAKARELESRYDENGFVRLRGVPNEEPLIAVGMAIYGQEPIADDGSIKADVMLFHDDPEVDVLRGRARLTGGGRRPSDTWTIHTPEAAAPALVHFNASFAEHPPYTTETTKLAKLANGWPKIAAKAYAYVAKQLPSRLMRLVKSSFRPVYRRIWGVRRVKQSLRG